MGNLTRDPQLSYLPSNTPVVEIGLAVNHKWRSQDGQTRESVCFIDCRAYGKQGETINQYMRKGQSMLVEGRLDFDQWEAQDGSKRSKHRVFIEKFTFVGGPQQQGGGGGYNQGAPANQAPQQQGGYAPQQAPMPQQGQAPQPPSSYDDNPMAGEDIPF